jgi:hypothetical protein
MNLNYNKCIKTPFSRLSRRWVKLNLFSRIDRRYLRIIGLSSPGKKESKFIYQASQLINSNDLQWGISDIENH